MNMKVLLALVASSYAVKLNYPPEHQIDQSPYDGSNNKVTQYNIQQLSKEDENSIAMLHWLQQNNWMIGSWQGPAYSEGARKVNVNRDGTFSEEGKEDGHVWLRPATGTLDLRTDPTQTGILIDRKNWLEADVTVGTHHLVATRLNHGRADNGNVPGGMQASIMKENDRYDAKFASENTLIGEWKGDANQGNAMRVLPNGHFTVWGANEPGLYSEELRHQNQWKGDMWVDLNNMNVDFNGKQGDASFHRSGAYNHNGVGRIDFATSDGSNTFVERVSRFNPKFSTNGH